MLGKKGASKRTGLFINFLVISSASGGNVAEKTPTCKTHQAVSALPYTIIGKWLDFNRFATHFS